MSQPLPPAEALHHHRRRMTGRDPHEPHRTATPLELLFDLTFVATFGIAAAQFAHALAESHWAAGLAGFAFASFAICWAWINFSWFASAYDTDDWIFRVFTMVQMIGALVLAIGLPRMFASVEHGAYLDNGVMVAGYVIMRIGMVFQWLRAANHDAKRRHACLAYAAAISIAQLGWVVLIFVHAPLGTALLISIALILVEFAGPVIAERQDGGTPWNPMHIAERHGLFAIIALGEGVVGTLAALSAVIEAQGWSMDAGLVSVAGIGLTLGIWWVYYMIPSAPILCLHRGRAFIWGYGQMLLVASIVATGSGLHVAALFIEHRAAISSFETVLTVAIPVGSFLVAFYALYTYMVQKIDWFHGWLLLGTAAVIGLAIAAAGAGAGMAQCLVILTLAPLITVVGYEMLGYRHQAEVLAADAADMLRRLAASDSPELEAARISAGVAAAR